MSCRHPACPTARSREMQRRCEGAVSTGGPSCRVSTGTVRLKSPIEEIGSVVILFFIFIGFMIDLIYVNKMELTLSSAKRYVVCYVLYLVYCIAVDVASMNE